MPNATTSLMDELEHSPNIFLPYFHFGLPMGFDSYDLSKRWQSAKLALGDVQPPSEDRLDKAASEALSIVKALCHYWVADGLAVDLLSYWKQYEQLLYFSSREYRDHFLHQFYVFLLGLKLLGDPLAAQQTRASTLDLKTEWEESADPRYSTEGRHTGLKWVWHDPCFIDQKIVLRLFRRWLLAACFHDIGYPAENLYQLGKALSSNFFSKVPGYKVPTIELQEDKHLESVLSPMLDRLAFLLLYDEWLPLNYDISEKERARSLAPVVGIFRAGLADRDHGVMGAIFFLLTMVADLQELPVKVSDQDDLLEDVYAAALAIAVHNLRIRTYPSIAVSFRRHPIAFLLMLTDELQEWDRTPFNTDLWDNLTGLDVATEASTDTPYTATLCRWSLNYCFRPDTPPLQVRKRDFWHNLRKLSIYNLSGGPSLNVSIDGQLIFTAQSHKLPTDHWPPGIRPTPNPDYFITGPQHCPDIDYCPKCQTKLEKR